MQLRRWCFTGPSSLDFSFLMVIGVEAASTVASTGGPLGGWPRSPAAGFGDFGGRGSATGAVTGRSSSSRGLAAKPSAALGRSCKEFLRGLAGGLGRAPASARSADSEADAASARESLLACLGTGASSSGGSAAAARRSPARRASRAAPDLGEVGEAGEGGGLSEASDKSPSIGLSRSFDRTGAAAGAAGEVAGRTRSLISRPAATLARLIWNLDAGAARSRSCGAALAASATVAILTNCFTDAAEPSNLLRAFGEMETCSSSPASTASSAAARTTPPKTTRDLRCDAGEAGERISSRAKAGTVALAAGAAWGAGAVASSGRPVSWAAAGRSHVPTEGL
mmetsp:Transcript_103028/g.291252  ORF Transcript_103028/g.291252 Transcript_103028/m.291252 type:complete len:339 (+) Transcript_103028:541-1557(+)